MNGSVTALRVHDDVSYELIADDLHSSSVTSTAGAETDRVH